LVLLDRLPLLVLLVLSLLQHQLTQSHRWVLSARSAPERQ
jgi:hypothetical protein